MLIYNQNFFKRKDRKIPIPDLAPFCLLFCVITMCFLIFICPIMSGIKVDLPKINSDILELYDEQEYATFNINEDGSTLVNGVPLDINELNNTMLTYYPFLKKIGTRDKINIFIKANKNVSYNTIVQLMQKLQLEGFTNITLVGNRPVDTNDVKVFNV